MADDQNVADGIVQARAAGYSDDEIAEHLAEKLPGIKKARDAGYTNAEILAHLGGAKEATAPKEEPSAIKDMAMQLPTGFNEAAADTLGAPVDAMNWGLGKVGLPVSQTPFLGSAMLKKGLGLIGANPDNAPAQTEAGKLARAAGGGVASAVIPEAGLAAVGSKVLGPQALAAAKAALGDGSAPLATAAAGAAGGVGSELAGQATEGTAAEPIARMIGGMASGGAAGAAAARLNAAKQLQLHGVDAVDAAAKASYNDPELKNLRLHQQPVNQLGDTIKQALEKDAFYREDHGPVFTQMDRLSNKNGPVSFDELEATRQRLGEIAGQKNEGRTTPTAAAAIRAKGHLDNFIDQIGVTNPAPQAVGNGFIMPNPTIASGNPAAAVAALRNARANAGASIRADILGKKIGNAAADNDAANSAMNLGNRIRQQFKSYIKNDEAKMAGFEPQERDAVNKVVKGDNVANVLRFAGNAMGGSGITIGPYVITGHAAVPAAGYALKKAANAYTAHQANKAYDMLLSRAPVNQPIVSANKAIKLANAAALKRKSLSGAMQGLAASVINN